MLTRDRAHAVVVERGDDVARFRLFVGFVFTGVENATLEEWHLLIEYGHVSGGARVSSDAYGSHNRSSANRVRTPRPDGLVPPMLRVAFDELS